MSRRFAQWQAPQVPQATPSKPANAPTKPRGRSACVRPGSHCRRPAPRELHFHTVCDNATIPTVSMNALLAVSMQNAKPCNDIANVDASNTMVDLTKKVMNDGNDCMALTEESLRIMTSQYATTQSSPTYSDGDDVSVASGMSEDPLNEACKAVAKERVNYIKQSLFATFDCQEPVNEANEAVAKESIKYITQNLLATLHASQQSTCMFEICKCDSTMGGSGASTAATDETATRQLPPKSCATDSASTAAATSAETVPSSMLAEQEDGSKEDGAAAAQEAPQQLVAVGIPMNACRARRLAKKKGQCLGSMSPTRNSSTAAPMQAPPRMPSRPRPQRPSIARRPAGAAVFVEPHGGTKQH